MGGVVVYGVDVMVEDGFLSDEGVDRDQGVEDEFNYWNVFVRGEQ